MMKKKNPFIYIKIIYASRYPSHIKNELLELLGKFKTFKEDYDLYKRAHSQYRFQEDVNYFYKNEILKDSSLFSLKNGRNIIIVGERGVGKSHIAREIAKLFNIKNGKNENDFYHFICTEETKCSDLIGCQIPKKKNEKEIYIEWKDGFITKAIQEGKLVILDNLHEVNPTIIERLNGLLDIKYDDEGENKGIKKKFDLPENPLKNSIEIDENFRIIGICDLESINQLSPAFLNRFDIIFLENQIVEKKSIWFEKDEIKQDSEYYEVIMKIIDSFLKYCSDKEAFKIELLSKEINIPKFKI
jgi:MoxR-like ATPase